MPWRRESHGEVCCPSTSHFLSPAWVGALTEPRNKASLHLLTDSPGPHKSPPKSLLAEQGQGLCLRFAEVVEEDIFECRKFSLGNFLFLFYFSFCLMPLPCSLSGET